MKYFRIIRKLSFGFFLVLFLSFVPLGDLFHPGLPVTHDGMDHVARIANFYKALSEGVLMPRWAENLNWGYGHPILMFLYPLSSYLASFFHYLSFSYIDSLKIVFGLGFVASGIAMYAWAREQFNEYCGIAAALLYLYSPYRFIDLYVRGALGEHMAFVFPPLILLFTLLYFKSKTKVKSYWYLVLISVSFCFLLLAHNAISLMFMPLFAVYALHLSAILKKFPKLLPIAGAFIIGFGLSAFFTVPAFLEGKFTLRDIVIGNEYKDRFVTNPLTFLYGAWNYGITGQFSVQIGIANILGILLLPFVFLKLKKNQRKEKMLLVIFLVLFFASLFIQMPQSDFVYQVFTVFKKFQFPWRFLSLTVFVSSVLGACIFLVIKDTRFKRIGIAVLLTIIFLSTFTYWRAKDFIQKPDQFYNTIYHGTTDTGESAPIWSIRFMEKEPLTHLEVIDGSATITELIRKSTEHAYQIVVNSSTVRLRENTLYFPSWNVYSDGVRVPIEFQDPSQRGLITFYLPKGEHQVNIIFQDTKLRTLSNFISIFSVVCILIGGIWFTKNKNEL